MGIFENRDKPKYVTCVAFTQKGEVITGDSNGNLIIWNRGTNTIARFIKNVHEGSVFSICVLKEGNIVTGGGKDGKLIEFDSALQSSGSELPVSIYYYVYIYIYFYGLFKVSASANFSCLDSSSNHKEYTV